MTHSAWVTLTRESRDNRWLWSTESRFRGTSSELLLSGGARSSGTGSSGARSSGTRSSGSRSSATGSSGARSRCSGGSCRRWCNIKSRILHEKHCSGKDISREVHVGRGTIDCIRTDYSSSGTIPSCNTTTCLISFRRFEIFENMISLAPELIIETRSRIFWKLACSPIWVICNDFIDLFN